MRRLLVLCCFLTLSTSLVALANNPGVDALRGKINALRAEEKLAVKNIRVHYDAIVNLKKLDERGRENLRKKLREGELHHLSLVKEEKQKEGIRSHYKYLHRLLSGEVRLDGEATRRLRREEDLLIRHVETGYHFHIRQLEEMIKAASMVKLPVVQRKKK